MDLKKVLSIFIIGGLFGFIFELLINTAAGLGLEGISFFGIPFLPLYGFGALLVYYISTLKIDFTKKAIVFLISANLLELATGLILLNQFGVRLWDYSTHFMNYLGFISLKMSIVWLIFFIIFHHIINKVMKNR